MYGTGRYISAFHSHYGADHIRHFRTCSSRVKPSPRQPAPPFGHRPRGADSQQLDPFDYGNLPPFTQLHPSDDTKNLLFSPPIPPERQPNRRGPRHGKKKPFPERKNTQLKKKVAVASVKLFFHISASLAKPKIVPAVWYCGRYSISRVQETRKRPARPLQQQNTTLRIASASK